MPKRSAILLGALALIYIALRFWRLSDSCLWFDEIFSVHAAEHPWSEIIPFIAKDLIHPPLFYFMLKIWIGIGGESVFWLRLLPVIFSILALFPLWMLCRELKLRPPAVIVTFGLFAVNGALIKYAQEVRTYSLLLFLSVMSVWLFSRYYFRGKSFWMLVIVNIFLVNTHYFGWFVVLSEVSLILISQRIKILRTLLMLAITVVAFVPWVIALAKFAEPGSSVEQNIGWMQRPGIGKIFELVFDLFDPFYFQQSSAEPTSFYPVAIPLLIIFIAAAVLYLINLKEQPDKEKIYFLAIFAGLPTLLVFILSWVLPVSIWGSRHLLIVFAPVTLLFAIYLTESAYERVRKILPFAIFALAAIAFVMQARTARTEYIWCTWEKIATEFAYSRNLKADEKLYAFEDLSAYHLWFALRNTPNARVVLVQGTGLPQDTAYFLPRGFDGVEKVDEKGIEGEWISITFRTKELEPTKPPLSILSSQGYEIVETAPFSAGESMVYLLRAKRR
ncbi:MAG: hypothetical protein HOP17_02415 [Acidobacteria bacterium]|nr:hypothetical protein [Acidobacteriota bacterium]